MDPVKPENFLFDFHTHIDFYSEKETDSVLQCILENEIKTYAASVNIESWEKNLLIKEKFIEKGGNKDLIIPTFGVHPSYAGKLPVKENEAYNLLDPYYEMSEIISETGLDFFWEKECPGNVQKMHLNIALDNAHKNNKVIVLHTKGAETEIFEILKDFPGARPVIHWYDGPVDVYKKFLDKGCFQTFGCELKYSNRIKEFLKMTPIQLVLPETDNPDGEPWLGGNDNSPLLIKRVYEDIAFVKEMNVSEITEQLNKNLKNLFNK